MKAQFYFLVLISFLFSACIGDDIIDDMIPERVLIQNRVDSIQINTSYTFEANFFNNIGQESPAEFNWFSTNETVLSIDDQGVATAHGLGETTVIARVTLADNTSVEDQYQVWVTEGATTVSENNSQKSGSIVTTSSYNLAGDFTLRAEDNELVLEFGENYEASNQLPGLYIYLTNNPNSINGAFEISRVTTFSGAHSYTFSGVDIDEFNYLLLYCKPFGVKVGGGAIEN